MEMYVKQKKMQKLNSRNYTKTLCRVHASGQRGAVYLLTDEEPR